MTLFAGADHTNAFDAGPDTNGNSDPSMQGWYRSAGTSGTFGVPFVLANISSGTTSMTAFGYAGTMVPSHAMLVHPGNNATFDKTVVRWTAPASGTYDISATWTDLPAAGNGEDVHIIISGTSVFDAVNDDPTPTSQSFTAMFLAAGATVDFVTGMNGSFGSDSTLLAASISLVPEPTTMVLMVMSIFGIGWRRFAIR